MKLFTLGKIAGALAVTIALAGCVDMTEEVNVTSDTTAKTTMTMTMAADIYAMMKSADAASQDGGGTTEKFCTKPGEQLTENKDGTATCIAPRKARLPTSLLGRRHHADLHHGLAGRRQGRDSRRPAWPAAWGLAVPTRRPRRTRRARR